MTLTELFTNIANSIRNKKGTEEKINATDFANEIDTINIQPILQSKKIEITENGTSSITADEGYYGLADVEIKTNVEATSEDDFAINDCSYLFYNNARINAVKQILHKCKEVTTTYYMFCSCGKLTSLDVSSFDTSRVTSMSSMFSYCNNLQTIIINNPKIFKMLNTNMLNSCPAIIYVPDDLVETYKSTTNWSTYADRIKGISELPEEV